MVGTLVSPVGPAATDVVDMGELCSPGKYVAAVYDESWYVGNIVDKDEEKQDVLVNFMRPFRTSGAFLWPREKDLGSN